MGNNGFILFIDLFDKCDANYDGYLDFTEFYEFGKNQQEQNDFITQMRQISGTSNPQFKRR